MRTLDPLGNLPPQKRQLSRIVGGQQRDHLPRQNRHHKPATPPLETTHVTPPGRTPAITPTAATVSVDAPNSAANAVTTAPKPPAVSAGRLIVSSTTEADASTPDTSSTHAPTNPDAPNAS
jgi:hypothetical protein